MQKKCQGAHSSLVIRFLGFIPLLLQTEQIDKRSHYRNNQQPLSGEIWLHVIVLM